MNKLLTLLLLISSSALHAQSPIWTVRNRENPKMLAADSALITPRQAGLYFSPILGKDSTGGMFYRTTDNKFYGKFAGIVAKPLASEDSTKRTLEDVLRSGNQTTRNILLGEISGGAYYGMIGFSDYARIQFTSTGDINNSSNLVFTAGDNNDANERFIFRKDTANNAGVSPLFDTLMSVSSGLIRSRVEIQSGGVIRSTNGAISSLLFYDAGSGTGLVGTFSTHPMTMFVNGQERFRVAVNGQMGIGKTAPAYKLDVMGAIRADSSFINPVSTATGARTLSLNEYYVNCTTAGSYTITLPAGAPTGRGFVIMKGFNSAGTITIAPATGLISGVASLSLSSYETSISVWFDGTNWHTE